MRESILPAMADNHSTYSIMLQQDNKSYLKWTPAHFRECIEIAHLSIYALDQDGRASDQFYREQKDVIDEMCNRIGYNFTVISAAKNGNQLKVTIKNTGLAPAFFNIDLCAEYTDANGNKLESFGKPVRIEKGTFRDGAEKSFLFEYDGSLPADAVICLAMYDSGNPLAAGKNPTVRFDNKNTLPTNRMMLVQTETDTGDVNADGNVNLADAVLLQKWLLAVPHTVLPDWKAGDMNGDNRLDACDLSIMKRVFLR